MRRSLARVGFVLTLALAGCRTLPPPLPAANAPWDERCTQLQQLGHFQMKGRVALAAGANGFSASLRWTQQGGDSQLGLEGPLGVGGMQIRAQGSRLDVTTSRGEHISDAAAHTELATRLGFDVPIASLRYWVLGVPDPGSAADPVLDPGQQRLAALSQDGWHISYDSYTATAAGNLPARLTLEREQVRVRLLVQDWQL